MGLADTIAENIFLDYKEFVVYGLGMGASLFATSILLLSIILSPFFSFVYLLSYNILKKIDKQKAKIILVVISFWIVLLPFSNVLWAYLFNTTFASFILGICIVKILEKRRFIAASMGYLGAMIAAIFSSVPSLDYSFYIWLFEREIPDYTSASILGKLNLIWENNGLIIPDIARRFDLIWNNELVIIALLLSILLMLIITFATKDPVFGFSVSFLIVLTFMWIGIYMNVSGHTQLNLLEGM